MFRINSRISGVRPWAGLLLLVAAGVTTAAHAEGSESGTEEKGLPTSFYEIARPDHVEIEKAPPETLLAKYPCPEGGVAPARYAVFGTNSGTLSGHELASPCLPVAVLHAADAIGMARGKPLGVKDVSTMVFTATGLVAPEKRGAAKPATVNVSVAYYVPGMRMDITREGGANAREIRVVADGQAWNEKEPGIGELPATGKADARENLIYLTPFGAVWALVEAQGAAKVSTVDGRTVIEASLRNGQIAVTLDEKERPERVRIQARDGVYEATFSGYTEKWEPAYLVPFPAKLEWRRNGEVIADLSTQRFHSNAYVVFPKPIPVEGSAAVKSKVARAAEPTKKKWISPAAGLAAEIKPEGETPRRADGRPDLSGYWSDDKFGLYTLHVPPGGYGHRGPDTFEPDQVAMDRSTLWNKPLYRPEHWQTVHEMDFSRVDVDPQFQGLPQGSPRQGPPQKIVQSDKEIVLWNWMDAIRFVPIDGRQHNPTDADEETYGGIGVGHWEADTLVVESVGFNDISWLAWQGYIHSNKMKLTERFRRVGDLLFYQFTVDDPDYLLEPWTSDWAVRRLNKDPLARPREYPPWLEDPDEVVESYLDPFYRG